MDNTSSPCAVKQGESSQQEEGGAAATEAVRIRVKHLVEGEDPSAPLSDEAIVEALGEAGLVTSTTWSPSGSSTKRYRNCTAAARAPPSAPPSARAQSVQAAAYG